MFLSAALGLRASSSDDERKSPAPDDDFWYGGLAGASDSGQHVSPETALRIGTVYACVRVLAETVAQLPLILYRRTDDDGKERAVDHPLWPVLHDRPNQWQTSYGWREQAQAHIGLRGNAYSRILEDRRGRISGLVPMLPDLVTPEQLPTGRVRYIIRRDNGTTENLVQEEVLHIPALSWDGVTGLNPIAALRESVGLALAQQAYGGRFFKNDTAPRGYLTMEGNFKDDAQFESFSNRWKKQAGGSQQHSTVLLDRGMEFKPVGMSMLDAQYLEQRKYQDVDIARMFRVPPHMVGILDRATFSNIEFQGIEFAVYSMMPWLKRWEAAINTTLLAGEDGMFVEFNVEGLLRGATQPRYAAYQSAIMAGWMTRNEVRRRENLDPLEGLDEPMEPLNMAPAGDARDGGNGAAGAMGMALAGDAPDDAWDGGGDNSAASREGV